MGHPLNWKTCCRTLEHCQYTFPVGLAGWRCQCLSGRCHCLSGGWVVGEIKSNAISSFDLKLKLKLKMSLAIFKNKKYSLSFLQAYICLIHFYKRGPIMRATSWMNS